MILETGLTFRRPKQIKVVSCPPRKWILPGYVEMTLDVRCWVMMFLRMKLTSSTLLLSVRMIQCWVAREVSTSRSVKNDLMSAWEYRNIVMMSLAFMSVQSMVGCWTLVCAFVPNALWVALDGATLACNANKMGACLHFLVFLPRKIKGNFPIPI